MTLAERFADTTVASAMASRATADAGAVYLRFGDAVWTFGQVDSDAEALAAALANLDIGAGDRVALVLPPRPEFAIAMLAAAKLGATIVPLNPRLTSGEMQYALRHSGAACAVTIEEAGGTDYLALFEELMPQLPDLRHLATVGEAELWHDDRIWQLEDLVSSGAGRDFQAPAIGPDDRFALVYTSGTLGKPKGVELSHANLIAAAAGTADAIGLHPADRVIGVSALFHVFGLASGLLSSLLAGASLVLQEDSGAAATLDAIERHRATVHYGIPTLFLSELSELAQRDVDLSTLRLAVVAGAPVSDELVDRVEAEMGVRVTTAYSLTETASTVSASRPGDAPEKRRFTVGRAIADTEVRVLETDGSELPVESVGEIAVRGPGVMLGYYRQPRETAAAFDVEGFFRTGDLGLIDEDGYLHLVGRRKDVIIRSGFNVYPREVEARVESHPAVQEVAVVGVPDSLLGEAICACVVPVEGAIVTGPEIVDWCRETLADDKIPDLVRFIDELPRTDTGQVRRVDLSRGSKEARESV
ncbi:MAG TPA: AMP-binding protein [Longimicrobiales bacterium]|nr:AMP-binding protein [Longimicrobiales bacterium]